MTNFGQDDHSVCPHMSCDFDLYLTFDLDIVVNMINIVNPAVDWPPLLGIVTNRDLSIGSTQNSAGTYFTHSENLSSTCFILFF